MGQELYVSLKKDVFVYKNEFKLSQVCEIAGVDDTSKLDKVVITFNGSARKISAYEVSKKLLELYPGYSINSIGEVECNVIMHNPAQNKKILVIKTILMCLIMFFGGAITIMTFHEDTNMRSVHTGIHEFFTGEKKQEVPIVSIPYSIGVAVGFAMLYGIFNRKKSRPSILDLDIYDHQNQLKKYVSQSNKKDG